MPETLGVPVLENVVGVADLLTIDFFVTAMVVTLAFDFACLHWLMHSLCQSRSTACTRELAFFSHFWIRSPSPGCPASGQRLKINT